jgi:GDSL-like Lipase/Acylhydrolase
MASSSLPFTSIPSSVLNIDTVVVFGDSLSDIGSKWITTMGTIARWKGDMVVSPTGRFSDCRNWTDFMFEAAGGTSLVSLTAEHSSEKSALHRSLSADSLARPASGKYFRYANYAEGGACGHTPASLAFALGTFKDQVDRFKLECASVPPGGLGNVLFLIWFGANDLYTAECQASQMGGVAEQVADVQRNALMEIVKGIATNVRFVFMDLARPLTSVRYKMRLKKAQTALKVEVMSHFPGPSSEGYAPIPSPGYSRFGKVAGYVSHAVEHNLAAEQLKALNKQMKDIENLEVGVLCYNSCLAKVTGMNGDTLVRIGSCLTEDTVRALVRGRYRLKKGAAPDKAKFISAHEYDLLGSGHMANITTIDEVHPSDELYRLIWLEIRLGIIAAGCAFGNLGSVVFTPVLSTLASSHI